MNEDKRPIRIVGLGASAGGLEALEEFFAHMPVESGLSFVVVQHVSPHYKSFMAELLGRRTGMPILVAEDGLVVEPNHIYLIPPQHYLTVENGCLRLAQYADAQGVNLPIDAFLASLAMEQGNQAIGLILSGTGTDGTRGIQAVHKSGGVVLVQDEHSAKFDGMPKSAVNTGIVDLVLSPAAMAVMVAQLAAGGMQVEDDMEQQTSKEVWVDQILATLQQQSGMDFTGYKKAGILRRIERRMQMTGQETIQSYVTYLNAHHEEVSALQGDLLIGVTHFFRDTEAFAVIYTKVIPAIVAHKRAARESDIRIWVAGCSTGEEAYTLAMLFHRHLQELGLDDINVRIFATDLDQESITYASQGIYPLQLANEVPPEYVARYFVKKGDVYQVSKELRKMVVFAPHNIIKDPPFVNLDLVSCRNMMIYFQSDVQKKILSLFHFSLHNNGYLFLGPSESIGKLTSLYAPLDKKWNIYRTLEQLQPSLIGALNIAMEKEKERHLDQARQAAVSRPQHVTSGYQVMKKADELYTTLIDEYMSPSLIIDDNNEVVHTFGDLSRYVNVPRGRMTYNVHKMVSTKLSVILGTGIHKVRKDEQQVMVYKNIKITDDGHDDTMINVIIKRFSAKKFAGWLMIIFEEVKRAADVLEQVYHLDLDSNADQRIRDLERELQYAQESLQATVEELETSNEELQSTNEELIASNEELQSTNEELQSVNEELISVNAEHQRKIQELTELNNDMDNFLISTKIGTIFLDSHLCIRRFTPAVTRIIHLLEVDIGRPISHISHTLKYGQMQEDARSVLNTNLPMEKEIQSLDGRWYNMGILPYRTLDNFIKGVVVTFVDITELKQANQELQKLSYAIHQSPSLILITDATGQIEYVNPRFTEQTGLEPEEIIGRHLTAMSQMLVDEEGKAADTYQKIWETLQAGGTWAGEIRSRRKDGHVLWKDVTFIPIRNELGEIIHYLKAAEDITEQKKTVELLRKSEMHSAVGQLAAGIAHEIRNPLTALKGFLQLIQADGEKNETYIKIMMSEFNRIEVIINELLLLSKPHVLSYKEEDLLVILQDVLMLLETQALLKQVTLEPVLARDLPPVLCVEGQVKQVFINLLKNAMEAMPDGGTIRVKTRRNSESSVLILIEDQGVGMPEEMIKRLGEPFLTTKEKGTGLGMMVSYKIIENHNGSLTIHSQVGVGTRVEIILPCA